jgi:hypothetical protein
MYFRILVTSALLFPGVSTLAVAQYGVYPAYTGYTGGGSTVAGSAASGAANVIQAQGQRNLANSQAAINVTQAQSQDLDNQLKYTQTYYEKTRVHDQYMQEQKAKQPKHTQDDYNRYAHADAPKRVPYNQLDPVTGHIAWPPALTTDDYSDSRQLLDKMFADRAKASGAIGYQNVKLIRQTTAEMTAKLEENVATTDPNDYVAAKYFLANLGNEARYPAH